MNINKDILEQIKQHSEQSAADHAAVSLLGTFLRSGGRINPNFAHNDKWPNTDGDFEFVSNPDISRIPEQKFTVQIKGTTNYTEENGIIKYSLKSLAFPAYMYMETSLDPGILFVVLNPQNRGEERVFWKYMSYKFLNSIDFSKKSMTISFNYRDEIKNTDESIDEFCKKLVSIIERHTFLKSIDNYNYSLEEITNIINACDKDITECIDRFETQNETRDNVSRRIINRLKNLCIATILYNSKSKNENTSFRLAYEESLLDINTKYLCGFFRGLKYIGERIPQEGQAERLMLKYYNFLWQIRKQLNEINNLTILNNLEKFPIQEPDTVDSEYYSLAAEAINRIPNQSNELRKTRYYIQKKLPFFIDGERYYELTLQLAGLYSTKYNRITAYTKENISTNYSIRIGYTESLLELWNTDLKIKVVTDWEVSIDPSCLNKLGKILHKNIRISSKYGEYIQLMKFLTQTGINFIDLIDLGDNRFEQIIKRVYDDSPTAYFREILCEIRDKYSKDSQLFGKNTIRYLLFNLREEIIERIMPNNYHSKCIADYLYISNKCVPFERNPLISNLAGSKSKDNYIALQRIVKHKDYALMKPYLQIKNLTDKTGEIYLKTDTLLDDNIGVRIEAYNNQLDDWEYTHGYRIISHNDYSWIDSYEVSTLKILQKLINHSKIGIKGQAQLNEAFLKQFNSIFSDELKKQAIKSLFVNSNLLLIYGAAGTGKTTLINHISNLMKDSKKLFLTKTYAALKNLERRIDNPGSESEFISIDSFTKKVYLDDFDIIFVDECSTIDNLTMLNFLRKINSNTLLVLAGDIYQIEAIDFGNWFYYSKNIIKTHGSNIELLNTWRTEDENLISLWSAVRTKSEIITEKLAMDGPYSENISENILKPLRNDEVVLCLNYDGKFGLNNINNYFQNANDSAKTVEWEEWIFKVGDPILFNDSKRFKYLYNNLKGKIVDINKMATVINFVIDVDAIITERNCQKDKIDFIEIFDNKTRISFDVYSEDSLTDDNYDRLKICTVIPFQLAYAVSIHKAQGLEYDSVKIIIPSSNAERITHGIFYTAITRAKEKLKIYWSSETMQSIVKSFSEAKSDNVSLEIIKSKLSNYNN